MERQEGGLRNQLPVCLPQQKLLQQEFPIAAPTSFRGETEPNFRACNRTMASAGCGRAHHPALATKQQMGGEAEKREGL